MTPNNSPITATTRADGPGYTVTVDVEADGPLAAANDVARFALAELGADLRAQLVDLRAPHRNGSRPRRCARTSLHWPLRPMRRKSWGCPGSGCTSSPRRTLDFPHPWRGSEPDPYGRYPRSSTSPVSGTAGPAGPPREWPPSPANSRNPGGGPTARRETRAGIPQSVVSGRLGWDAGRRSCGRLPDSLRHLLDSS
jgi:hypothetical protein